MGGNGALEWGMETGDEIIKKHALTEYCLFN
jgi:hypothetical protein